MGSLTDDDDMSPTWRRRCVRAYKLGVSRVPPGVRSALGLVLIVAGFFGFLPILGFWMIPLGLLFIALDVPALRRRVRRQLVRWRRRHT